MKSLNSFKRCLAGNVLAVLSLFSIQYQACSQILDQPLFRISFYNVENLFHPDNDSLTRDDEFTPDGERHWSYYRYHNKLNQMAKAILSIGAWDPPAVVGLEEIENREVINDLISTPVLSKIPYRAVHYDSEDRRGIDVALIYRKDRFKLIYSRKIRPLYQDDSNYRTRDILYVKGTTESRDTLHLFVCHWPSRYGGQAISEPRRIAVSNLLRNFTDSLLGDDPHANIIIGGDFNDEPSNLSLLSLCKSDEGDSNSAKGLTNLMREMDPARGSNRHHGIWTYLDQIIVSNNLLIDSLPSIYQNTAQVHRAEFLLEEDLKYPGDKPYRHFLGLRYNGGFSDHLPVYVDLILSQTETNKELYLSGETD